MAVPMDRHTLATTLTYIGIPKIRAQIRLRKIWTNTVSESGSECRWYAESAYADYAFIYHNQWRAHDATFAQNGGGTSSATRLRRAHDKRTLSRVEQEKRLKQFRQIYPLCTRAISVWTSAKWSPTNANGALTNTDVRRVREVASARFCPS